MRDYGLKEVWIPENDPYRKRGPKVNIFMSQEFLKPTTQNSGRHALVLIQGTGQVRAGMWTRSVCINDCLEIGSMLPQIEWAVSNKIPVLVMNPNYNRDPDSK